jgi:LPS O-antigen subunit length determinant protein (WzzB/FepE family)
MFNKLFHLIFVLALIGIIAATCYNLHVLAKVETDETTDPKLVKQLKRSKMMNVMILIIAGVIFIYYIFVMYFTYYRQLSNLYEEEYEVVKPQFVTQVVEADVSPKVIVSPLRSGGKSQSKK